MSRRRAPRTQRRYDPLATLDYIERYKTTHANRAPSQRRICAELAMSAPSVAHAIVHRLARKGLLIISEPEPGLSSELELTDMGREQLDHWRKQQNVHSVNPGAHLRGAA